VDFPRVSFVHDPTGGVMAGNIRSGSGLRVECIDWAGGRLLRKSAVPVLFVEGTEAEGRSAPCSSFS